MKIAFIHIPRTGGTATLGLLRNLYLEDEICPFTSVSDYKIGKSLLKRYKLFGGHVDYETMHNSIGDSALYMTFLRNPLDRAISHILFLKKTEGMPGLTYLTNLGIDLSKFSVDDFVRHQLLSYLIRDRMVNRLGNGSLDLAKERLTRFFFVGITDKFDESIDRLLIKLIDNKFRFKRNLCPLIGNTNSYGDNYSKETIAIINSLVEKDWELYKYGLNIFNSCVGDNK